MGNIRVNQTVNINQGGGGGGSATAWLVAGALLLLAASGGGLSVATGALVTLLWWLFGTIMAVVVLLIVLAIVFRRHIVGPGIVRVGEHSLLNMPDRDMPVVKAPEAPREIIHTHRHYVMGPGEVYAAPAGSDWTKLGDFDVVEAEILP